MSCLIKQTTETSPSRRQAQLLTLGQLVESLSTMTLEQLEMVEDFIVNTPEFAAECEGGCECSSTR